MELCWGGSAPQDSGHSPELLELLTGYRPKTTIAEGVKAFAEWYRGHYRS